MSAPNYKARVVYSYEVMGLFFRLSNSISTVRRYVSSEEFPNADRSTLLIVERLFCITLYQLEYDPVLRMMAWNSYEV